jgi:hypothetical protein
MSPFNGSLRKGKVDFETSLTFGDVLEAFRPHRRQNLSRLPPTSPNLVTDENAKGFQLSMRRHGLQSHSWHHHSLNDLLDLPDAKTTKK